MFESLVKGASVDAAVVRAFADAIAAGGASPDDAERIDMMRALEVLKCAAEGRQAREAVDLDASQRAQQADAGERPDRLGRGVAQQVALARRVSPHRGQRLLGLAKVLHAEMPHTLRAFRAGRIPEWRATILVRETAMLEREERAQVDAVLAGDPDRLEAMGDRELASAAASLAARLDPASVARRRRRAEEERSVTIRPAPDTMTYVTALLPVAQGVAVHAALTREAAATRAAGDPRSQGQVMADTLVERVTGQSIATAVPTAVTVVISDTALLTGTDDDALVAPGQAGGGVVPAELARELVRRSLDESTTSLRRLYAAPTGRLVAMESTSRCFPAGLAELVRIRDEVCRTPWCDAPIRHIDHVVEHDDGGETSYDNGQGLCEACNHAKQALGWRARAGPQGVVHTTTPTGHRYRSIVPSRPPPEVSRMEVWFRDRVEAA